MKQWWSRLTPAQKSALIKAGLTAFTAVAWASYSILSDDEKKLNPTEELIEELLFPRRRSIFSSRW